LSKTFTDLGLSENILKALETLGFETPTPIQALAIPHLLDEENDLIGLAQTGTGKTAAFSLPILQNVDLEGKDVQALILSPTRELCLQIARDIESFSSHMDTQTVAVYGGADIRRQIKLLQKPTQIVVGTPGRTLDLIQRGKLKVHAIGILVLDEADEMLSMGFQESLDAILAGTPKSKQTILFSATMPKEIRRIAAKYMHKAKEISVISEHKSASNVSHEYYVTNEKNRYLVLKRLADFNHDMYGIVFCRTRRETQLVADRLMQDGYNSDSLHGDLSQAQRDAVMKKFRNRSLQMLVATDVAARGIDVDDLTHVINFNLPDQLESYVHRSGRTGRANKNGICITIVNEREVRKISILERKIERKFQHKLIPGGAEICKRRLFGLIGQIEEAKINKEQLDDVLPQVYKKLSYLSKEELIDRIVALEFNRFLEYYQNAGDLNAKPGKRDRGRDRKSGDRDSGRRDKGRRGFDSGQEFTRYFLNVGKEHNVNKREIITLINQTLPGKKLDIGAINLQRGFSFFEIEKGKEDLVLSSFKGKRFRGHSLAVDLAEAPGTKSKKRGFKGRKKKRKKKFKKRAKRD